MGVAEDDHFGIGIGLVQQFGGRRSELISVGNHEVEAFYPGLDDVRQSVPKIEAVGVAVDRRHRCNRLELIQECHRSDVSRVENMVHLAKDLEDLGPQKPMSI